MNRNVTVVSCAAGGAGASTVAAGLACALAQRGCSTLVLELYPLVGAVETLLGSRRTSPYHLGDAARERCLLAETFSPCETEGVTVAGAPRELSELPQGDLLRRWLLEASREFDQVVIDAPWWSSCFGEVSSQATTTLLVCEADPVSLDRCDRLRTSGLGRGMNRPRLVINRFHRKQFWKKEALEDLDAAIDRSGLQPMAVVPEDPNLAAALGETMRRTKQYETQKFSQKGDGGAIALHCLASRLLGENVPLRNLDRL